MADTTHLAPEALRLRNYVERRKRAKQLDVNKVPAFDTGCDTEAELLLFDVKTLVETLLSLVEAQQRATQPAPQPSPASQGDAELPDADRDYMRKVIAVAVTMLFDGYKEDVTRVFSPGELSEFVTITAAMGGERVEDIYRRAWDLLSLPDRASHGQAPAQAAPQQEAQEPVAWQGVHDQTDLYYTKPAQADVRPLYTTTQPAPQPLPASQGDALDAARYRWLRIHAIGAFRTNDGKGPVSVYHLSKIPAIPGIPEETDAAIDAARKQGANHD